MASVVPTLAVERLEVVADGDALARLAKARQVVLPGGPDEGARVEVPADQQDLALGLEHRGAGGGR